MPGCEALALAPLVDTPKLITTLEALINIASVVKTYRPSADCVRDGTRESIVLGSGRFACLAPDFARRERHGA